MVQPRITRRVPSPAPQPNLPRIRRSGSNQLASTLMKLGLDEVAFKVQEGQRVSDERAGLRAKSEWWRKTSQEIALLPPGEQSDAFNAAWDANDAEIIKATKNKKAQENLTHTFGMMREQRGLQTDLQAHDMLAQNARNKLPADLMVYLDSALRARKDEELAAINKAELAKLRENEAVGYADPGEADKIWAEWQVAYKEAKAEQHKSAVQQRAMQTADDMFKPSLLGIAPAGKLIGARKGPVKGDVDLAAIERDVRSQGLSDDDADEIVTDVGKYVTRLEAARQVETEAAITAADKEHTLAAYDKGTDKEKLYADVKVEPRYSTPDGEKARKAMLASIDGIATTMAKGKTYSQADENASEAQARRYLAVRDFEAFDKHMITDADKLKGVSSSLYAQRYKVDGTASNPALTRGQDSLDAVKAAILKGDKGKNVAYVAKMNKRHNDRLLELDKAFAALGPDATPEEYNKTADFIIDKAAQTAAKDLTLTQKALLWFAGYPMRKYGIGRVSKEGKDLVEAGIMLPTVTGPNDPAFQALEIGDEAIDAETGKRIRKLK